MPSKADIQAIADGYGIEPQDVLDAWLAKYGDGTQLDFSELEDKIRRTTTSIKDAAEKGCDTYLTSDLKYHDFLLASEWGINLIDGDHFCTENPVMNMLKEKLSAEFPEVSFQISSEHEQIISFMI